MKGLFAREKPYTQNTSKQSMAYTAKQITILFVSVFFILSAIYGTNITSTAAQKQKTGFVKEKDGTHYYKKGKSVKGKQTIGSYTYCFNKKGVMIKNAWYTTKKGIKYYLQANGTAATGREVIKGYTYMFSNTGRMLKGCHRDPTNGKAYYFSKRNGVMLRNCWYTTLNGKRAYFGNDGAACTGLQKIGSNYYYFNSYGIMMTGKIKSGNCLYYAGTNGVIYRKVDGSKKMVALTFDDGPSAYTPIVLDTLDKYDAVATFFVVGNRVSTYKSYVQRAYKLGCEIGTHTYDHAYLHRLSASQIKSEVEKGSDEIVKAIGVAPTLMRPPGGCINSTVSANVGLPMILWSVDTRDWETRSTPTTISRVVNGAYDGAIILVHDLHQSTAIASKTFIPKLINAGYQLVTVSEMAELRGITLQAGKSYTSLK